MFNTETTDNLIKISKIDIEDFIYMSYRYCIGRKSIASYSHAITIFKLIKNNPDLFTDARKQYLANDIRNEIEYCIKWDSFGNKDKSIEWNNYKIWNKLACWLDKNCHEIIKVIIDNEEKELNVFRWSNDYNGNHIKRSDINLSIQEFETDIYIKNDIIQNKER